MPGPFSVRVLLIVASLVALAMVPFYLSRGLTQRYFANPYWSGAPRWTARDPVLTLHRDGRESYRFRFSIEWTGVIYLRRSGEHRFSLASDDRSQLWIDDALVVYTDGGDRKKEGLADLAGGFHAIRIRYVQFDGDASFAAGWRPERPAARGSPGEQPLSTAMLLRRQPSPVMFGLIRLGAALAAARWAMLVAFVALALLPRLVGARRGPAGLASASSALALRARAVAAYGVEIALLATLAVVFWTALSGGIPPPIGLDGLTANPYAAPLLVLAALFTLRRVTRGSVAGGVQLPLRAVKWASRARVRLGRLWSSRSSRVTLLVVSALAAGALGLIGLSAHLQRGLTGRYYDEPDWSGPLLATARDRALTLRRPIYDLINPDYLYSVDWTGVVHIPVAGDYEFALGSDGAGRLWLDESLTVELGGAGAPDRAAGVARLRPGFHAIRVSYAHATPGPARLSAGWRRLTLDPAADRRFRPLSDAVLLPERPTAGAFLLVQTARQLGALGRLAWLAVLTAACLAGAHWLLQIERSPLGEHHVHLALLGAVVLLYLAAAFGGLRGFWGFSYLSRLGLDRTLAGFVLAAAAALGWRRHRSRVEPVISAAQDYLRAHPAAIAAVGLLSVPIFFGLRSEFLNSDGILFRWQIPQIATGAHEINFDEMWEKYLHSRFWLWTNAAFGWSVRLSYQVLSSIAGGAFVVLLWTYGRRLLPAAALGFCLLMVSGGYMQLFFGEVEHYTLVAVVILAYLVASAAFLQGRLPLIAPSATLALAMTFHMLAAFLLPSLGVLFVIELRRRAWLPVGLGAVAFGAVIGVTTLLVAEPFDASQGSWGTNALREALAGLLGGATGTGGGESGRHWAPFAFDAYHWDQYNLLALMFPAHLLAIPLILARRIRMDRINVHLIAACFGMAVLQFNYRALLSVQQDWNLFANASIPIAVLVWRNLLRADGLRNKAELAIGWAALSFMHSSSWILSNHRFVP